MEIIPSIGSALKSPTMNISAKGSTLKKFERSYKFDWNSWSEIKVASSQHKYTLNKTKECDIACTFKPITLLMKIIWKKLMVTDVFQSINFEIPSEKIGYCILRP